MELSKRDEDSPHPTEPLNTSVAPEHSSVPTLELRDVTKSFHNDILKKPQKAVENLSLKFPKGLCTALLGHNGAGKTTTIRMIFGLIRPDQGSILFEGAPLATSHKKHFGYMPEVNKLPLNLTVEEVLQQAIRLYGSGTSLSRKERRDLVQSKLLSISLEEHKRKKVGKLSKGMARRLAFAQATIHKPRLLILDEPSTGLDPNAAETLIEHIELEKNRGTTIILCTHDLVHINALCDGFYMMRKGHLVGQSKGLMEFASIDEIDWGSGYGIQVSGVSEEVLQKLKSQTHLPQWDSLRLEGQMATLGFDDYSSGAQWLAAFLANNYLILRFGDGKGLTGAQIRKFFRGQV
jgi:ABC-2 type transport system ATP-binding protein